jgi:hypothetical protein
VTLDERHVAPVRTPFLAGLVEREAELHGAIETFLAEVEARSAELREKLVGGRQDPLSVDAITKLEAWCEARQAHADTLNAANDPERERALRQELAELEGREKLGARLAEIEAWIAKLKRIEALNQAFSGLATNRITTKQRDLPTTGPRAGATSSTSRSSSPQALPTARSAHSCTPSAWATSSTAASGPRCSGSA